MPETVKLTQNAVVAAKPGERRYTIADTEIAGFWLVVTPTGRKSFYYRYRVGGGRGGTVRQPLIGHHPALKAEAARRIAAEWAACVRMGGDPAGERTATRVAPTMNALLDRYLEDHARPTKKLSSLAEDERLIRDYLRGAFGRKKVAEVRRSDIADFQRGLAHKPYRANRCLALLSKAFNLAEVWAMRPGGSNPCRHLQKYAEAKRKRFLSPAELARLGETLAVAERDGSLAIPVESGGERTVPISAAVIAAIRLLVLTGARKGEILGLRWDWIDWDRGLAALPDSKTGEKAIHLPPAALAVLETIPRREDNPHVIFGGRPGAPLVNLKDPWGAIRAHAGFNDVRIHDLRHSFASVGAAGGLSLPIIGALLGHTQAATTQRYAHLADDPLRAAAGQIGDRIAAAMSGASADIRQVK